MVEGRLIRRVVWGAFICKFFLLLLRGFIPNIYIFVLLFFLFSITFSLILLLKCSPKGEDDSLGGFS